MLRDPLGVGLTEAAPLLPILDVAGEISQRGVLGGKQKVALALENPVEYPENVGVAGQLETALVFPAEILGRHLVGVHRLQHDLLSCDPVFRQPDPAVPTFPAQTISQQNSQGEGSVYSEDLRGQRSGVRVKSKESSSVCLVHRHQTYFCTIF